MRQNGPGGPLPSPSNPSTPRNEPKRPQRKRRPRVERRTLAAAVHQRPPRPQPHGGRCDAGVQRNLDYVRYCSAIPCRKGHDRPSPDARGSPAPAMNAWATAVGIVSSFSDTRLCPPSGVGWFRTIRRRRVRGSRGGPDQGRTVGTGLSPDQKWRMVPSRAVNREGRDLDPYGRHRNSHGNRRTMRRCRGEGSSSTRRGFHAKQAALCGGQGSHHPRARCAGRGQPALPSRRPEDWCNRTWELAPGGPPEHVRRRRGV